jgi:hypothetical protein
MYRKSVPPKSHKNPLAENYSASNSALGSGDFCARGRISVNNHPFSLEVSAYLMNTRLSVQFEPLPKAIGPKLS